MDKIIKVLSKLLKKEKEVMLLMLKQIERDHTKIPGVKALIGYKGLYRVRVGQYRVIFSVDPITKKGHVEDVARRNEKTYRRLK